MTNQFSHFKRTSDEVDSSSYLEFSCIWVSKNRYINFRVYKSGSFKEEGQVKYNVTNLFYPLGSNGLFVQFADMKITRNDNEIHFTQKLFNPHEQDFIHLSDYFEFGEEEFAEFESALIDSEIWQEIEKLKDSSGEKFITG